MKVLHRMFAFLAALSLILVLLVSAAEAAIYIDFNFYQKEYEKYQVLDELDMEMGNVMDVTHEMMAYLHGRRDDLMVKTTVSGVEQEFFNDREKSHMIDVKNLFSTAMTIRTAALLLLTVSVLALIVLKQNWKRLVSGFYMLEVTVIMFLAGILGYLFTQDFNKYFIKFHEIFFDNDLWLLDPETDLMIRMLPEGFFADFAARIGIFAGVTIIIFFAGSFALYRKTKQKERR